MLITVASFQRLCNSFIRFQVTMIFLLHRKEAFFFSPFATILVTLLINSRSSMTTFLYKAESGTNF